MSSDLFSGALRLILGDSEESSEIDPEDVSRNIETMTEPPARSFLTVGEVIVRLDQVASSTSVNFSRKIYCPELDVAGSLAEQGVFSEFFTVLPHGYYESTVRTMCAERGVDLRAVVAEEGSHTGDMTVLADAKNKPIHQRRYSAFHSTPPPFRWEKGVVSDRAPCWVHTCVSSFVWSDYGLSSWMKLMETCVDPKRAPHDVLTSISLRASECQVEISELWKFVEQFCSQCAVIFLTPAEAIDINGLMTKWRQNALDPDADDIGQNENEWMRLAAELRSNFACECVCISFPCQLLVAHQAAPTPVATATTWLPPVVQMARFIHAMMVSEPITSEEMLTHLMTQIATEEDEAAEKREGLVTQVIQDLETSG